MLELEGSVDHEADGYNPRAATHLLGIYHDHAIKNPDELEPGHPCYFTAPRHAKAAAVALLERHPEAAGFEVLRLGRHPGHYRTVAQVWR